MSKFVYSLCCLIILATALLSSCNENTNTVEVAVESGFEYFPLEIDKYMIYQVDSTVFDTSAQGVIISNSTNFVKEEVVDTLRDNSGRLNYRVERSIRATDSIPWQVTDEWVALRTESQAERVEENLRFIKIVFPMLEGSVWNGNLFIDETTKIDVAGESVEVFKNWSYELDKLNISEEIGGMTFDSVATIYQADSENLIELRYSMEKYARNVGLVYREMRILDTQTISESIPWESKAQKGFILRQEIIEFN